MNWKMFFENIHFGIRIPFRWTGFNEMNALLELLDAIHSAYSRPEYTPKEGKTYCNKFVSEVCTSIGFKDFDGMLANQIFDEIAKNVKWSEETNLERCQDLANNGTLIVAAIKNEPHGHVVVICPGKIKESGRWGKVPSCASVGKINTIGKGINWAFSSSPRLYIYKPTL